MSIFRFLGFAAAVGLAILVAGCLHANESCDAFYDKATDTLHVLVIDQDITAENDADKVYAGALWQNRSDFIPGIFDIELFSTNGLLRLGDHQFLPVDLGQTQGKPEATTVEYHLNQIKIHPGVFFRGADKHSLCYYQEVELPGTVVDGIFAGIQKRMFSALALSAAEEIKRRKAGGAVSTWDEFRSTLSDDSPPANQMTEAQKTDREFKSNPYHCLSDVSLAMFVTPPADVKFGFTRQGNQISLAIPLSPGDQPEALKAVAIMKKKVSLDFDAAAGPGNVFTVSTTLVSLVEAAGGGPFSPYAPEFPATNPATQPADPDWVKTFGGKIDPHVTLQNIHDQFVKGTLPVDQAATSEKTRAELFKAAQ